MSTDDTTRCGLIGKMRAATRDLVGDLFQEAENEGLEDRLKEAKARIKSKLKQLQQARQAVRNIELEIDDLKRELGETL